MTFVKRGPLGLQNKGQGCKIPSNHPYTFGHRTHCTKSKAWQQLYYQLYTQNTASTKPSHRGKTFTRFQVLAVCLVYSGSVQIDLKSVLK